MTVSSINPTDGTGHHWTSAEGRGATVEFYSDGKRAFAINAFQGQGVSGGAIGPLSRLEISGDHQRDGAAVAGSFRTAEFVLNRWKGVEDVGSCVGAAVGRDEVGRVGAWACLIHACSAQGERPAVHRGPGTGNSSHQSCFIKTQGIRNRLNGGGGQGKHVHQDEFWKAWTSARLSFYCQACLGLHGKLSVGRGDGAIRIDPLDVCYDVSGGRDGHCIAFAQ